MGVLEPPAEQLRVTEPYSSSSFFRIRRWGAATTMNGIV